MAPITPISPQPNSVVISQPMYFPWVGILEQICIAEKFVYYNDVQYVRGFFNRVQIKTIGGMKWLTVPLRSFRRGQLINEVELDESIDWRAQHRDVLRQAYLKAPFLNDMLELFDRAMSVPASSLADVARNSTVEIAKYFGLIEGRKFYNSEELQVFGRSTERLLEITRILDGNIYVTGHGAKNYLNHDLFERAGVSVRYMSYQMRSYEQQHGPFTPYVTALDLVANCGLEGVKVLSPTTVHWKEFVA